MRRFAHFFTFGRATFRSFLLKQRHSETSSKLAKIYKARHQKAYRVVAIERLEIVDTVEWGGILNPLERLPGCYEPHVVFQKDFVHESHEPFLVMRCFVKPRWMKIHRERCPNVSKTLLIIKPSVVFAGRILQRPVGFVMAFKVSHQRLFDQISIFPRVFASVTHGTFSFFRIVPHHHGNFPDTWEWVTRYSFIFSTPLPVFPFSYGFHLCLLYLHLGKI